MAAPAIRLFADDPHLGLVGVRFPVELRADGFDPERPSTWPQVTGRIEYVGGRLLYMPPCADFQQDVAMDLAFLLRSWSETRPEFIVGGNEAGMKVGGDIRAADAAVWRASEAGQRTGHVRSVPPVLAAEIAGQDEEERVLRDKARWYLEHGVRVVWLVLPDTREVVVITALGDARFRQSERLAPQDDLPGLQPEVSRFFVQIDRRS
ncbi:MAG: Uma2 family endonuclease [Myxococcales bacterium]|nr:Uma2 family endonuclease [Myxococcales bacterium]